MMEGSEKKKIPVTLEPSPEGDKGKISEILTEGNHQKNKKKKEDKETEELKKKLEDKDKEAKENYDRLL